MRTSALKNEKKLSKQHARPMRHAPCAGRPLYWASGASPCAFVTTAPARGAATAANFQDVCVFDTPLWLG